MFLTFQSAGVTLKIRPRSPKNQLFPFSKQWIYASLVKIRQLVQKIMHRNHIFGHVSAALTLKIRSRSPKFNQLFPSSQQCINASLVKIHPLVQKSCEYSSMTVHTCMFVLAFTNWLYEKEPNSRIMPSLPIGSVFSGL